MAEYFSDDSLCVMASLIGLGRSLENDPEPLGDVMTLLMNTVVAINKDNLSSSDKDALKAELLEAKRRTVPSCFVCPQPCGHNDDYPQERLSDLDRASTKEIFSLLSALITSDTVPEEKKRELCIKSIVYISSDFEDEYIQSLISTLRVSLGFLPSIR